MAAVARPCATRCPDVVSSVSENPEDVLAGRRTLTDDRRYSSGTALARAHGHTCAHTGTHAQGYWASPLVQTRALPDSPAPPGHRVGRHPERAGGRGAQRLL